MIILVEDFYSFSLWLLFTWNATCKSTDRNICDSLCVEFWSNFWLLYTQKFSLLPAVSQPQFNYKTPCGNNDSQFKKMDSANLLVRATEYFTLILSTGLQMFIIYLEVATVGMWKWRVTYYSRIRFPRKSITFLHEHKIK